MHLTHNRGMSVVARRFMKTLKGEIYKKMTTNGSKSCLGQLHKLMDETKNTYHHSIGKKAIDADYSDFTEKIELCH